MSPPRMNSTQQQQTTMEKVKLTLIRTVKFYKQVSVEDVRKVVDGIDLVKCSEQRLRRVWENLVDQTGDDGEIEVGGDYEEEDDKGEWLDSYLESLVEDALEEVVEQENVARESMRVIMDEMLEMAGKDETRIKMVVDALNKLKSELE